MDMGLCGPWAKGSTDWCHRHLTNSWNHKTFALLVLFIVPWKALAWQNFLSNKIVSYIRTLFNFIKKNPWWPLLDLNPSITSYCQIDYIVLWQCVVCGASQRLPRPACHRLDNAGFEPATSSMWTRRSTTELIVHGKGGQVWTKRSSHWAKRPD